MSSDRLISVDDMSKDSYLSSTTCHVTYTPQFFSVRILEPLSLFQSATIWPRCSSLGLFALTKLEGLFHFLIKRKAMGKRLLFLPPPMIPLQGSFSAKLIIARLRFLRKNAKTSHFLIFFDCSHLMWRKNWRKISNIYDKRQTLICITWPSFLGFTCRFNTSLLFITSTN